MPSRCAQCQWRTTRIQLADMRADMGHNNCGQLGLGDRRTRKAPRCVKGLAVLASLSAKRRC